MRDLNIDTAEFNAFRESRFYDYYEKMLLAKKILANKGVHFLFVQVPLRQRIVGLSAFEMERLENWTFDFNNIKDSDLDKIYRIYENTGDAIEVVDYLRQVYDGARVYELEGIKYLANFKSKYVNIINGRRLTYNQPNEFISKIYVYGQCTARGTGVKDSDTIESFLQSNLNDYKPNTYCVENCAIGCGSDIHDDIYHLEALLENFNKGDIVIFCTNLEIVPIDQFKADDVPYYDTSSLFNRPHDIDEWFTDMTFHTTPTGNKVIADYIYSILKKEGYIISEDKLIKRDNREVDGICEENYLSIPEFNDYLKSLSTKKKDGSNGAIVMNCNPFTLGHKYLIEYAAAHVDNLYVFVVEEDRSRFPFADRINLVKEGIELSNVIVMPSGKFIISAVTFPGYFIKDGNTEIEVNVTDDVLIFAKYIAPVLNIKIRFAGQEQMDYVTRKYNEEMSKVLPQYGIKFVEIPRKEINGKQISASVVRKLLEKKEFDEIRQLVPICTWEYLKKNYG